MPAQTPQQALEAAQADAQNAETALDAVKRAQLDGGASPADVDAAETRARHAQLARDAARVAHEKSIEQALRDAWPPFRDAHVANLSGDPAGDLQAALDKVAPKLHAALADLEAALAAAKAPADAHNNSVAAIAQYVADGHYTDPDDHASGWTVPGQMIASAQGRSGHQFDAGAAVDRWLADQLPVERIAAWLERVRINRKVTQ